MTTTADDILPCLTAVDNGLADLSERTANLEGAVQDMQSRAVAN